MLESKSIIQKIMQQLIDELPAKNRKVAESVNSSTDESKKLSKVGNKWVIIAQNLRKVPKLGNIHQ